APAEIDTGVVVTEDAGVFFHAGRVAGHFAELDVVGGVRRLLQDHAILGEEVLVHAFHGLLGTTVVLSGAAEHAPALALDEDLALGILFAAHGRSCGGVSATVPLAVPRLRLDRVQPFIVGSAHASRIPAP